MVTVVISDLHVASGPLDDCDAELERHIAGFLEMLSRRETAVELVVNGDFLDFVQAVPWTGVELESVSPDGVPLCFSEEQSVAKLESIQRAHPPIFDALSGFLRARPGNTVTILPGNHDVDFYWPDVQRCLTERVGPVRFHLDPVYRPSACPSVWIEHGHQFDPINCFTVETRTYWSADSPPVFVDPAGTSRLYECVGTRFLIKFLNRLDRDYPFIDNVKPFSRFLRIFAASAIATNHGSLKAAVTVGRLLSYLATTARNRPVDILGIEDDAHVALRDRLARHFNTLSRARADALVARMAESGFTAEMALPRYLSSPANAERLLTFLSDHPDVLDDVDTLGDARLGGAVPGTLTLAPGFTVDESKVLLNAARDTLARDDVALVIMGHTHEPVFRSSDAYINTGSWTRYYRFSDDEPMPWHILAADSYVTFPYQLLYVELQPDRIDQAELTIYQERHG
jgi:UDP-2,3-diacylglucosamine pyrophosphatase LpxH